MELQFSDKEIETITLVSFHYYYNRSKFSTELNTMTANLLYRIADDPPMTVMEAGITTAISYFLDQKFLVSVNNQFPAVQQPVPNVPTPLPENWRNNIVNLNEEFSNARYYIRKNDQTYYLRFTYDSIAQVLDAHVNHTVVKHKDVTVQFSETYLKGLTDPQHQESFALHFIHICSTEWELLVRKALKNLPPTAQKTPS